MRDEKLRYLKTFPTFKKLPIAKLKEIVAKFKTITPKRGGFLFKEGEAANYLYIVRFGAFKITKNIYHKRPDLCTSKIF